MKLPLPDALCQALEHRFTGIPVAVQEQRLLHAPALDVGDHRAKELEQQKFSSLVAAGECVHVAVEYRGRGGPSMPFAGDAYGGEVVGVVRVQRFSWLGREVQHAVGEVDQVLMAVQVGNGQRTQVGDQVLQNLVDRPHPDQFLVVCCNEALDHPQHHVVRVLAEAAVLVDVLERPSGGVVAHNQILKVLSAVTSQKRHRDAGNPAGVKGDERGRA